MGPMGREKEAFTWLLGQKSSTEETFAPLTSTNDCNLSFSLYCNEKSIERIISNKVANTFRSNHAAQHSVYDNNHNILVVLVPTK